MTKLQHRSLIHSANTYQITSATMKMPVRARSDPSHPPASEVSALNSPSMPALPCGSGLPRVRSTGDESLLTFPSGCPATWPAAELGSSLRRARRPWSVRRGDRPVHDRNRAPTSAAMGHRNAEGPIGRRRSCLRPIGHHAPAGVTLQLWRGWHRFRPRSSGSPGPPGWWSPACNLPLLNYLCKPSGSS